MGLRHGLTVGSLADIATRRHDQLQELTDDDHLLYLRHRLTDSTQVEVINSIVETDIYNVTLPANTLTGTEGLELFTRGTFLNNTVGAQTGQWRFYVAGLLRFDTGAISLAQSASRRGWEHVLRFLLPTGAIGIAGHARFAITDPTAVGVGVIEAAVRAAQVEDTSTNWGLARALRLTMTLGAANANLQIAADAVYFQHLR